MILEDCLSGKIVDPDAATIAFDDLNAAAKAKTPYAQLQKLREDGGGLKLAYKLSSHVMLKNVHHYCRGDPALLGLVH